MFDRPKPTAGCSANGRRSVRQTQLIYSLIIIRLATCFHHTGSSSGLRYEPIDIRKLRTFLGSQTMFTKDRYKRSVCCWLTFMFRMFMLRTYNFTTAKLLTYKKSKNLFFLASISEFIAMKYTSNKNCIFEGALVRFVTYKTYFTKSSFERRQNKVI